MMEDWRTEYKFTVGLVMSCLSKGSSMHKKSNENLKNILPASLVQIGLYN
jgi:hypothetical protein